MGTINTDNRCKKVKERLIDRSYAERLLLDGFSYREVATITRYSKSTISIWANEPKMKKALSKMRLVNKQSKKSKQYNHLGAFMLFLSKKYVGLFIAIYHLYCDFIIPEQVVDTTNENCHNVDLIVTSLLLSGETQRRVSDQTGISLRTINKIAKRKKVKEKRRGRIGRIANISSGKTDLNAFISWIEKKHKYYYDMVEPVYSKYTTK